MFPTGYSWSTRKPSLGMSRGFTATRFNRFNSKVLFQQIYHAVVSRIHLKIPAINRLNFELSVRMLN